MRRAALLVGAGLLAAPTLAETPPPAGAGVPEGCAEAVTLFCADPSWPGARATAAAPAAPQRLRRAQPPETASPAEPPAVRPRP